MNKKGIILAVIIGIFGFANIGMAAQRMITEQSLDKAYTAQIADIEHQIQVAQDATNKAFNERKTKLSSHHQMTSQEVEQLDEEVDNASAPISELQHREYTIKVSYQLMKAALQ